MFYPPSWAPKLNDNDIPDDISLGEFVFNDKYRPHKCDASPAPFINSIDGAAYSVHETQERIEWLAAGLASELGIQNGQGDEWDRVVSIFAVNNVSLVFSGLSNQYNTHAVVLDLQPLALMGNSSLQWCSGPGQCGIPGIGTRISAQGLEIKMPIHQCISSRDSPRSGQDSGNTCITSLSSPYPGLLDSSTVIE